MTPDQLIRALGGVRAVATHLGQTYQSVHHWAYEQCVPAKHHVKIWMLCVERGVAWQPPGSDGWSLVRGDRR
mgnify:CR=1 FL=1